MTKLSAQVRTLPVYSAGSVEVPYIVRPHVEFLEEDTDWAPHSHPTHELLWIEGGASTLIVHDTLFTITKSWGMWIPAGMMHSGFAGKNTTLKAAQFNFSLVGALSNSCVTVEITPLMSQLLERLSDENLGSESRNLTERMIVDVLCPAEHGISLRSPRSLLVQPIVKAMMSDPSHQWSLRQWAHRLEVSTKTVTRVFQEETGLSFSRWIAAVRVHHAIRMLASGMAIEEVSQRTGYATTSGFGAAFRRVTGRTPGSFKEALTVMT